MDSDIEDEIVQKHDQAEAFISLFFAGVDAIIYIIVLSLFGCQFRNLFSQKQKISFLILVDAIMRIVNLYTTSFIYSFPKDLCLTIFATCQFFLIINILNQTYTDKSNPNFMNNSGITYKPLCTILFFVLTMKCNISKMISLVQYILAIIALIAFGVSVMHKNTLFLLGIQKKTQNFSCKNFVSNIPLFIIFYFFLNYVLKILGLLVENPLYCSYMEMACDIFKEVGKYLSFNLVISAFYLHNKYVKDEDFGFESDSQNQSKVNIQLPKEDENLQA